MSAFVLNLVGTTRTLLAGFFFITHVDREFFNNRYMVLYDSLIELFATTRTLIAVFVIRVESEFLYK